MRIPVYQIDTFSDQLFQGNPAAVCPLQSWLDDAIMQSIAAENNLSETAFFVPTEDGFGIRWFTPTHEVDLCGHATLASAYVIFHYLHPDLQRIIFQSRSGRLKATRSDQGIELDFPAQPPTPVDLPPLLKQAFHVSIQDSLRAQDYILVLAREQDVLSAQPDLTCLRKVDGRGVIITAQGMKEDFVCRFFAPKYGIDEDPVTGSAYTQLMPYWTERIGKIDLHARQLSSRGGLVHCRLLKDRVLISGQARLFLQGSIHLY